MTITYTWKVTNLKVKNEDSNKDSVVQVQWQKIGTDTNGNVEAFNGSTSFSSLNIPEGQSFVPFEKLTEDIILGWIQSTINSEYDKHINTIISERIDIKSNAITDKPLPWAQANTANIAV